MTTAYEKGDKVVVEIKSIDGAWYAVDGKYCNYCIKDENILGKLEDFQPTEEKIKMTPEEKKEFDRLKGEKLTLYLALKKINQSDYPFLFQRMWNVLPRVGKNKVQVEFAIAWGNPSRIEVIEPEKHKVKIGIQNLYFNEDMGVYMLLVGSNTRKDIFTLDEVKEAEEQLGIQGLQTKWHKAAKKETK